MVILLYGALLHKHSYELDGIKVLMIFFFFNHTVGVQPKSGRQ